MLLIVVIKLIALKIEETPALYNEKTLKPIEALLFFIDSCP